MLATVAELDFLLLVLARYFDSFDSAGSADSFDSADSADSFDSADSRTIILDSRTILLDSPIISLSSTLKSDEFEDPKRRKLSFPNKDGAVGFGAIVGKLRVARKQTKNLQNPNQIFSALPGESARVSTSGIINLTTLLLFCFFAELV
jgi:hypothetical protein